MNIPSKGHWGFKLGAYGDTASYNLSATASESDMNNAFKAFKVNGASTERILLDKDGKVTTNTSAVKGYKYKITFT